MEAEMLFAGVNDAIRKLAAADATQPWDFFCECSDIGCRLPVALTASEFDERRAASPRLPILAAEHPEDNREYRVAAG
jgi:hypothetical protein